MTVYDDRLEDLRGLVRQSLDVVVDVGDRKSQATGQAVDRLEHVLGYAVAVLDIADADLIAEPFRATLTAQLSQLHQSGEDHQLRDSAIFANAETWADQLLVTLATFAVARDQEFAQLASDAASDYHAAVHDKLTALDVDFNAAEGRVDQIMIDTSTRLDQLTAEADTRRGEISEHLDQLGVTWDARLAEFDQTLTAERAAIEQTKTSQAETFRAAQDQRDVAFKAAIETATADLDLLLVQSKSQVKASVADIRRMEEESAALVGAIGLAGTAERYGQEVIEQRKVADTWRLVTVVLAGLAAIGVVAVAITLGHDPEWQDFLGKLSASALIGGLAAYAARQSARHREREERARNFQLELTAFSPFIEPLSKEQREEERVVMTRKTFGNGNTEFSTEEETGPHPLSWMMQRKQKDQTP